jgi:threonine/homoserine/homoserine lactone efflux protein
MLIALLIALGVDLVVVLAVAVLALGRRRWLKRQPGEFTGAIRVSGGVVEGLSPT